MSAGHVECGSESAGFAPVGNLSPVKPYPVPLRRGADDGRGGGPVIDQTARLAGSTPAGDAQSIALLSLSVSRAGAVLVRPPPQIRFESCFASKESAPAPRRALLFPGLESRAASLLFAPRSALQ